MGDGLADATGELVDERAALVKLRAIEGALQALSFEREGVIRGLLCGLLAGQHVLLLGPPGTDKSRLARLLCSYIVGARYFGRLLTKFTQPEELFGPLDIMRLERGEYRRVFADRLPNAEIAFLDEVFKSGSAILNTLLELMNERTFNDGTETHRAPLRLLVGASNELSNPEDGLSAFDDRFLLRFQVGYLEGDDTFERMLVLPRGHDASAEPNVKPISIHELAALERVVRAVRVPQQIMRLLATLRKKLTAAGVVVSDRRWFQMVDILQANAVLEGRTIVGIADFVAIVPCCWRHAEEIAKVRTEMQKLPSFVHEQLQAISLRLTEVRNAVHGRRIAWIEAREKLSGIRYEVDRILEHADSAGRVVAEREALVIRKAIIETRQELEAEERTGTLPRRTVSPLDVARRMTTATRIDPTDIDSDTEGMIAKLLARFRRDDGGDDESGAGSTGSGELS